MMAAGNRLHGAGVTSEYRRESLRYSPSHGRASHLQAAGCRLSGCGKMESKAGGSIVAGDGVKHSGRVM